MLLGDRGYQGYETYCEVIKSGADFLFRVQKCIKPKSRKRIGKREWIGTFKRPRDCKNKKLPEEIKLRYISYDTKGFRTNYLLTTLFDIKKYSREKLVCFYAERWQIETRYNELKHMIEIEELRSQTKEGIIKEVIVHITIANLVRLVMLEATKEKGIQAIDLSYKHALEKIKDTVIIMLRSPVYLWIFIYRRMIKEIGEMKILKRPGRSYSRHQKRCSVLPKSKLFVEVSYAEIP